MTRKSFSLPIVATDAGTIHQEDDAFPCTILAQLDKLITVRVDQAILIDEESPDTPEALVFSKCDFVAHIMGPSRYRFQSDAKGPVYLFTRGRNGLWTRSGGGRFMQLTLGRRAAFYDFNRMACDVAAH